MTDETKTEKPKLGPLPGESMLDYASRRLVELENSKKTFIDKANFVRGELRKAEADIIACDARISEMRLIIQNEQSDGSKKP